MVGKDGKRVLIVGAGRQQRGAIIRARELGLRVVAVDRDPGAPGLALADSAHVIDFTEVDAVIELGKREQVDGVLAIAVERAVPVVAAVAESLGLPGIGPDAAHAVTHKVAMRRLLAEHGVAQPRFAAVRTLSEARLATDAVGFPAVLKPADARGGGVFRVDSRDDLDRHLHTVLIQSPTREAILERYHDGLELNALLVVRRGETTLLTLSNRLRRRGAAFGVGWAHVYPATLFGDRLADVERTAVAAAAALRLRDGIAFVQLLATRGAGALVVEVAAGVPGEQMADLARHAVGADVVEAAIRQALGEQIPDELLDVEIRQPLAIRFLTAEPGPLPTGVVERIGGLDRVLQAPGVVQAEVFLAVGDTIPALRQDRDRRGYVIAVADTNVEALDRAASATQLLEVEVAAE